MSRSPLLPLKTDGSFNLATDDIFVIGSNSVFGSRLVASEEVDLAFGMPSGK
jgi:hypothetical protein